MIGNAACGLKEHGRVFESRTAAFSRYGLLISILAVYLLFPTRNYYWDGIGTAESIERSPVIRSDLVHPNHFIYDIFGFLAFRVFHTIGLADRVLYALQLANAIIGTLTLYFFMQALCHLSRSVYLITLLTSLFAVSATWLRV